MSDNTGQAFKAIQAAIFTLLDGAIDAKVYDEVPDDAEFPYVVLGEPNSLEWEARSVQGRQVLFPIEIWSRDYGGKQEIYDTMEYIIVLMTAGKLSMTGWSEVQKTYSTGAVGRAERQPGNLAYRGTISWIILVAKT